EPRYDLGGLCEADGSGSSGHGADFPSGGGGVGGGLASRRWSCWRSAGSDLSPGMILGGYAKRTAAGRVVTAPTSRAVEAAWAEAWRRGAGRAGGRLGPI